MVIAASTKAWQLLPDAWLGIGPPIEHGYDNNLAVATPLVHEDLTRGVTRMRKVIKEGMCVSRWVVTDAEAIDEVNVEPLLREKNWHGAIVKAGVPLRQAHVLRGP